MSKPETCYELTRIEAEKCRLVFDHPVSGREIDPDEFPTEGTITFDFDMRIERMENLLRIARKNTTMLPLWLRDPFVEFYRQGEDDG